MGTPAQNIIATFDQLPDAEKQEVATAILRRTLQIEFPPISDNELVLSAEETFLELDRREAEDCPNLTAARSLCAKVIAVKAEVRDDTNNRAS